MTKDEKTNYVSNKDYKESRKVKICREPGCGKKEGHEDEHLTVDHVVPKALGGSEDDSNRELLCREHHDEKERGGSEDGTWTII
jgi:5-methylcytosine-specific restriction endonuclease McrA